MNTSSSEYETPSVESGFMPSLGEEEEFSRVKMHSKNQDLLAEVLVKDKEKVRTIVVFVGRKESVREAKMVGKMKRWGMRRRRGRKRREKGVGGASNSSNYGFLSH